MLYEEGVAPHWRTVLLKFGIITAPLSEELQAGSGSALTLSDAARACVEMANKVESTTIVIFMSLVILITPYTSSKFSLNYNSIVSTNLI
jgi:hypothetical protein